MSDDDSWKKRYIPLEAVGRGSAGVVYRCLELQRCQLVALKCGDTSAEANILKLLTKSKSHKFLLKYYELSPRVITSDFATIGSLERCIKSGLHLPWLAQIANSLLRALECVHKAGIIHRDVKPSNVLVMADGSLRLADFSAAIIATSCQESHGSFHYMSPERLRAHNYGTPADIWSLGILLLNLALRGTLFSILFPPDQSDEENFWPALEIYEHQNEMGHPLIVDRVRKNVKVEKHPTFDNLDFQQFIYACLLPTAADRPSASDWLAKNKAWPQHTKEHYSPAQRRAFLAPYSSSRLKTLNSILDALEERPKPFVFTPTHLAQLAKDCELPQAAVQEAIALRTTTSGKKKLILMEVDFTNAQCNCVCS